MTTNGWPKIDEYLAKVRAELRALVSGELSALKDAGFTPKLPCSRCDTGVAVLLVPETPERLCPTCIAVERDELAAFKDGGWHALAKEAEENGDCPACFAVDEAGHEAGCIMGEAERLRDEAIEQRDATIEVTTALRNKIAELTGDLDREKGKTASQKGVAGKRKRELIAARDIIERQKQRIAELEAEGLTDADREQATATQTGAKLMREIQRLQGELALMTQAKDALRAQRDEVSLGACALPAKMRALLDEHDAQVQEALAAIPGADYLGPCETCGEPATVLMRDVKELQSWGPDRRFEPMAETHLYCEKHNRESVTYQTDPLTGRLRPQSEAPE